MILSFKHKGLARFFEHGSKSGIQSQHAEWLRLIVGRLSIAFNASAESWLSQQVQYDLWHAEQGRKALKVSKLAA